MSDSLSPNIGLLIADPGDVVNYNTHVGNNLTRVDTFLGMVDCLSTSRPTTTFKGQGIYEEDSKRYAQNLGTSASPNWVYMTHQAMTGTAASRPTSGLTSGEIMYETDTHMMRSRATSAWNPTVAVFTAGSLPSSATSFTGDFAYVSDKSSMAAFNGTQWFYATPVICTNGGHPVQNTAAGTQIFETDTLLAANNNGSGGWLYEVQQVAATQLLGSTTASITFSGLSSLYTHLSIAWTVRDVSGSLSNSFNLTINGDSGAHYGEQFAEAQNNTTTTNLIVVNTATSILVGRCAGGGATAGYWSGGRIDINGWNRGASGRMVTLNAQSYVAANTSATGQITGTYGGGYLPTAALTSFTLASAGGSLAAGSEVSVHAFM